MLSIIVAVAKNNAIGKDNKLLWHLPEDLKRFQKITEGKTVIMGRKTFESLPGVLKNRKHVIVTGDKKFQVTDNIDVNICYNMDSVLHKYSSGDEEIFIIGGESVYRQAMPYCKKIYLTVVEKVFEADTFFPDIDYSQWNILEEYDLQTDASCGLKYRYITLERKNDNGNL